MVRAVVVQATSERWIVILDELQLPEGVEVFVTSVLLLAELEAVPMEEME